MDLRKKIVVSTVAVISTVNLAPISAISVLADTKDNLEKEVTENTLPVIKVPTVYEIFKGDEFNPLDIATARDLEDGDIILSEKNILYNQVKTDTPGEYKVKYEVIDNHGGRRTKTITVIVKDVIVNNVISKKPVITFPETTTIKVGESFEPLKDVSAKDYNGAAIELTKENIAWNKVDTTTAGEYQVKYTVTDSYGNRMIVYRNVTVQSESNLNGGSNTSESDIDNSIKCPSLNEAQRFTVAAGSNINGVGDSVYEHLKGLGWTSSDENTIKINDGRLQFKNMNGQDGIDSVIKIRCDFEENNKYILYLLKLMIGDKSISTATPTESEIFSGAFDDTYYDNFENLVRRIANGSGMIKYSNRNIKVQYDGKADYTITLTFYNYQ